MKSFFELIGFIATALFSGFLVFLYIGKTKTSSTETYPTPPTTRAEVMTTYKKSGIEYEEDFTENIAGKTTVAKTPAPTPKRTTAPTPGPKPKNTVPTIENDLREIFTDEVFAKALMAKWKTKVATAATENDIRAGFLMGNVMVQTYLGTYTGADFQRDLETHRGDALRPETAALKTYQHAKTVAALSKMYDLDHLLVPAAPKFTAQKTEKAPNISTEKKGIKSKSITKKAIEKPAQTPKKVQNISEKINPAEAAARQAAAKELGFSTWEGLQFLADAQTKTLAEKRVKSYLLATRIR